MNHASIHIRAARPCLEEGRQFAFFLNQAAEGFFNLMLGKRSTEILAEAFVQAGHDLSYQHVSFLEQDQNLIGMVAAYTAQQHQKATNRALLSAAGKWNVRMLIVSTLFAPLLRVINTVKDNDFYIQAIAVNKDFRGKGLGALLMDHAEGLARASGSSRISLDVSAENNMAYAFYKRRNMTIESQWPKRLWFPGLCLVRMVKSLKPD